MQRVVTAILIFAEERAARARMRRHSHFRALSSRRRWLHWLMFGVSLGLLVHLVAGCAGDAEARGLELEHKDGDGKALRPYDDEPALPDAGQALTDGGVIPDGSLADASNPPPDAYTPPPDASKPAQDGGQAAPDASDGAQVDAGAPMALAGAWRVRLAPVGMPCAGAAARDEDWQIEPTETTVSTPQGTLSKVASGFEGILGGEWVVNATLVLGAELGGTYARKGPSCSDRWTLTGVRL